MSRRAGHRKINLMIWSLKGVDLANSEFHTRIIELLKLCVIPTSGKRLLDKVWRCDRQVAIYSDPVLSFRAPGHHCTGWSLGKSSYQIHGGSGRFVFCLNLASIVYLSGKPSIGVNIGLC